VPRPGRAPALEALELGVHEAVERGLDVGRALGRFLINERAMRHNDDSTFSKDIRSVTR